jgi:hypothetical protein
MESIAPGFSDRALVHAGGGVNESSHSAISWAAILYGAAAAMSVTLILGALGAGLNLTSISPWANSGVSATTFTIAGGIGLIVVQWVASGIGGYLTGRLRTKWVGVHTHEVFFRDTAHGFMAWSVATVLGAALLASAASSVVGGAVHAASTVASGTAQGAGHAVSGVSGYDVDSLFRGDHADAAANTQNQNEQATRILAAGLTNGNVPDADKTYLAQMIATRTGISPQDAQKRVDDVIAREQQAVVKAKQEADAARKAAAKLGIYTALSMLIGAFIASVAAAYGGGLRDDHDHMNQSM